MILGYAFYKRCHGMDYYINNNMDVGDKCIDIFLDLGKIFDIINRRILINKLEYLGIRGVVV